jgi:endonuclease-8
MPDSPTMPEGHTIHRLARGLRTTLGDQPVQASSPQGRFSAGAALIDGERILRSDAWGKYLFVAMTGGQILHVHLGLIGKFRPVVDLGVAPRDTIRLRLANDGGTWDLTGPTRCELITPPEQKAIVAQLGPDPLRRNPDADAVQRAIARTNKPIGAVLLDQRVIAGIGNVYRAEILFVCGIRPTRAASTLDPSEVEDLWSETVRLMRIGLRMGVIITTDPVEIGRSRPRMRSDDRLYVYHREYCRRCGTELVTVELGGRPISYCPVHQP